MWQRSRKTDRRSGFSLTELLVTLAMLTVILTVSAQLLFETRRAAMRQQIQVETRQLARAAVDYVHYLVRGASDLNYSGDTPFPAAYLSWVGKNPNFNRQVSYNNLDDADLGDLGTDIITIAQARDPLTIEPVDWTNFDNSVLSCDWQFNWGCDDVAANLEAFRDWIDWHVFGDKSRWLLVADQTGAWRFYQINEVSSSTCAGLLGSVKTTTPAPNSAEYLYPIGDPNAQLGNGPRLRLGVTWVALRVRDGWLEQKNDLFDPDEDDPGADFVQLLPNIEDLQIAYLFSDGQLWNNTAGHTLPTGGPPTRNNGVPWQGNPGSATDATNVIGMRITVTARAPEALLGENRDRFRPLPAEDHVPAATPDRFYRYQASSLVMMRNRNRAR